MFRGDTAVLRLFESDTYVKLESFKQVLTDYLLICPMLLACKRQSSRRLCVPHLGFVHDRATRLTASCWPSRLNIAREQILPTYFVLPGSLKKRFGNNDFARPRALTNPVLRVRQRQQCSYVLLA